MVNSNIIICFDFETGGLGTETLEPVQIAGAALDPRTLQVKDTFASLMRPLDFNNLEARALEVNKKTIEELKGAPEQALVWRQFCAWVKKHNRKGGPTTAPIPAGKNILRFDLPIAHRLCRTYGFTDKNGKPNIFNERPILDLEEILWLWFENSDDLLNYRMDTVRPYFGLPSEGAHDALVDVLQTVELIRRFLNLHRTLKARRKADGTPVIQFEGSCRSFSTTTT